MYPRIDESNSSTSTLGISANANSAISYNTRCNEEKGTIMAIIINKNKFIFKEGYLTHKGTIVSPSFTKAYLELEEFLQRAKHNNAETNKLCLPCFKKESIFSVNLIEVPEPATPALDKAQALADKTGEELALIRKKQDAEEILEYFNAVVEMVIGDTFIIHGENYHATIYDTPMLGNPLELTKEKLLKLVCAAAQYPLD